MINFLKKKFNKNLKHGTLFFTFPNGEKLYLLNESEFEISIEHRKVILNHFPMLCYGGTYRKDDDKVYQLFGHVHSGPNSDSGLDIKRLINLFPTQYDVGVDNNEFRPISWGHANGLIQIQINNNK